jgi:YesN/AraC family two-component response regulator
MTISVLLVDDDLGIRAVLRAALRAHGGFEVVGEAVTATEAAELAEDMVPDVVVLDLGLPDATPKDVLMAVRRASPTSKVVVFSGGQSDRPWFEQRAEGYVVKDAALADLIEVLQQVGSQQAHDHATLELPRSLLAPGQARAVLREVLEQWDYGDLVDDALLVLSELVANAVEHADAASVAVVNRGGQGLRIEVRDQGEGVLTEQPEMATTERGRGLMIVSALARSWGVQTAEKSKTVWVELPRDRG